jgi:hypothetical protein
MSAMSVPMATSGKSDGKLLKENRYGVTEVPPDAVQT